MRAALITSALLAGATPAVAQPAVGAFQGEPARVEATNAATPVVDDPWEGVNRRLFSVHKGLDRAVVGPVARGYTRVTPAPVRGGVRNVLNNLGEPVTFVNDVLQGKITQAGKSATRFVANSTVGVLGIFDVATPAGVSRHTEDFGQTLAVYGVKPGPYLFIPVLGPSNVRDAGGRGVDVALNPINYAEFSGATAVRAGAVVVGGVGARARLDPEVRSLEANATDEYATYRSLYGQNRQAAINNGRTDVEALPEFEDFSPPPPEPTPPPRRRRR